MPQAWQSELRERNPGQVESVTSGSVTDGWVGAVVGVPEAGVCPGKVGAMVGAMVGATVGVTVGFCVGVDSNVGNVGGLTVGLNIWAGSLPQEGKRTPSKIAMASTAATPLYQ